MDGKTLEGRDCARRHTPKQRRPMERIVRRQWSIPRRYASVAPAKRGFAAAVFGLRSTWEDSSEGKEAAAPACKLNAFFKSSMVRFSASHSSCFFRRFASL